MGNKVGLRVGSGDGFNVGLGVGLGVGFNVVSGPDGGARFGGFGVGALAGGLVSHLSF